MLGFDGDKVLMNRILRALEAATGEESGAVPEDLPLKQLAGWDSMRAVNFQLELEQEFGVNLSDAEITGASTLADIASLLRARKVDV
jgi:acyl carrier protein